MICHTRKHKIPFLIDEEDYDVVKKYTWGISTYGYVYTKVNRTKTLFLHRMIMNAPSGMEVDHINRDTLNNHRDNLRICTRAQNQQNCKSRGGTSKYKGVCWENRRNTWRTTIKFNGKQIHIGEFMDEIEAAKAYNGKAIEFFGEFARLNPV